LGGGGGLGPTCQKQKFAPKQRPSGWMARGGRLDFLKRGPQKLGDPRTMDPGGGQKLSGFFWGQFFFVFTCWGEVKKKKNIFCFLFFSGDEKGYRQRGNTLGLAPTHGMMGGMWGAGGGGGGAGGRGVAVPRKCCHSGGACGLVCSPCPAVRYPKKIPFLSKKFLGMGGGGGVYFMGRFLSFF